MEWICNSSPLWDYNLTWNTTSPDVTSCFQQTVAFWIPCGFLWISVPYELHQQCHSTSREIPWNFKNITKCIITVFLTILSIIAIMHNATADIPLHAENVFLHRALIFSHTFLAATYIMSMYLVLRGRHSGIQSSGPLFLFWLLLAIAMAIVSRSSILKLYQKELKQDLVNMIIFNSVFSLVLMQLCLACFADELPRYDIIEINSRENVCPDDSSSVVSQYLYCWLTPLLMRGSRIPLSLSDIWTLASRLRCKQATERFELYWNKDGKINNRKPERKRASTTLILWKAFWPGILTGFIFRLLRDALLLLNPLFLNLLLNFVSSSTDPQWKGWFYAVTLFISVELQSLLISRYFFHQFSFTIKIHAALVSTIYKKTLRLSNYERQSFKTGEIVHLMSIDAKNILTFLPTINWLWSAPLQTVVSLYFLWQLIGPSTISGIAYLMLLLAINAYVGNSSNNLQVENMKTKDERTKLFNEILKGIKVLKLYAWEQPFVQKVTDIRTQEISVMRKLTFLNALMRLGWRSSPFIVALLSFGTFIMADNKNVLTPNIAFVSIALLNIIRETMRITPEMIFLFVQAHVSISRINGFLAAAEVKDIGTFADSECAGENDIVLSECTFCWNEGKCRIRKGTLQDINMKIKHGSLVAIIGNVGSGKTSLLSAILGEMITCKGQVKVCGNISYVPQLAWIQNATVKENIVMHKDCVKSTYEDTIDRCGLREDLYILPGGDLCEIGEMGINLSGGQKQRISLARAVYHDAEIYLLDDPLSSVDSHVGKHIFEQVIGPKGILKNKTRLFATHGVSYLPYCDTIIFMKNGKIKEVCDYNGLMKNQEIVEFVTHTFMDDKIVKDKQTFESNNLFRNKCGSDRKTSTGFENSNESVLSSANCLDNKLLKSKLIHSETVDVGRVGFSAYHGYFRSVGKASVIWILIAKICAEGLLAGSNVWLSQWSSYSAVTNKTFSYHLQRFGLGVYGGLGLGQAFYVGLSSFGLVYGTMNSAKFLHDKMLKSVMRSPMHFFDTTPIGRILNRFSKDINVLDSDIAWKVDDIVDAFLQITFTIIVICLNIPLFVVCLIPILTLYCLIQRVYVLSSTQLKRLESVTRSPIFTHFSESLTGTVSIRAYGFQSQFIEEFHKKVDINQRCFYFAVLANRWCSVRLEFIANCVVLFTALFAVYNRGKIDAGSVGLTVSYAMSMTTQLLWIILKMSELEMYMVSVERILEYCKLTEEAPWSITKTRPPNDWPKDGVVEFHSYSVTYRSGLDLALANLNFHINAGEKIGICGRTGAGKSTLMLGLFRLLEASNGCISIDDVNISHIGLQDLRSKLTVVPQDPVLFAGNLRFNLDPFLNFSDEQVWEALGHAHLKHFVSTLDGGLMYEIAESGENLSVGQRQLICLARALLRKTKIILLDEATAATDLQTDLLIQETVKKVFADCTVLTIAHRLTTIMDSTRVMVLDFGCIIEFDSPSNLLQNSNSLFYQMVKDDGLI
ncbi:ABCC2 (predicted) [Pycnogonum litorale]